MKFKREDYGWVSDDPAGLLFYGEQAPETVQAFAGGHRCLEGGATVPVFVVDLVHVRTVACGSRGPARQRWSSNARYSLYRYVPEIGRPETIMVEVSGLGVRFLQIDQLCSAELGACLAELLPDERLWDLLSCIVGTWDEAWKQSRREVMGLFLVGRLKKRRREGRAWVQVKPEVA